MSDVERNWIQNFLDTTYTRFKSLVAKNRKMDMQTVENLAQGHVYTGKTALGLKLVDALGNQQRAIQSVAGMAKLKEYKLVEFPKPKDKISDLIASITGKKGEDARIQKLLGDDYVVFKELQKIRSQQNRIQMVMPWMIQIN
jgi:protease-4